MRKSLFKFSIILLVPISVLHAQQWNGSATTSNNIYRYGDISVHYNGSNRTTLGAAWGGQNIGYGTGYLGFNLSRNNHSDGMWVYSNDGLNNGASVIYSNISGDILFSVKGSSGATSGTLADLAIKNNIKFRINNDGKVVIGNAPEWSSSYITWPNDYRLYVETGILTEKLRVAVKTSSYWADYVFKKDYKLMSLTDLRNFIARHNHLPNVPSADELVTTGLDVADMQRRQMQKIEELTLYVIQLNQKIEKLEKRIANRKKR